MNDIPIECSGLWGYLFGHKFAARYDEKIDYPPGTAEAMQASLDAAMKEGVALAFDAIETITEGYRQLDTNESTYVQDVCTRCGHAVKRSETISQQPVTQHHPTTQHVAQQPTPTTTQQAPRTIAVPAGVRVVSATPENVAKMMSQPPGAPGSPVKAVPGRGPK